MFLQSDTNKKDRRGFTLIELVLSMAAGLMIILIAGFLFQSGYRSWLSIYNYANSQQQIDTLGTITTLGVIGRKSNKTDYKLYTVAADRFLPVIPLNPEKVVQGQAVELRYWDTELDESLMDTYKTATAYVLLYLAGDELMADYGPYPPGGINSSGRRITSGNINTVVLARNVASVEFSHTTKNLAGDGKGCVRMKMVLINPANGSTTTVVGATLMRNTWP